jgi:hypothetical protein
MNSFDYNLISENNIKHVIKFNDLTLDEKFLYFITKIEITGHDNNFMTLLNDNLIDAFNTISFNEQIIGNFNNYIKCYNYDNNIVINDKINLVNYFSNNDNIKFNANELKKMVFEITSLNKSTLNINISFGSIPFLIKNYKRELYLKDIISEKKYQEINNMKLMDFFNSIDFSTNDIENYTNKLFNIFPDCNELNKEKSRLLIPSHLMIKNLYIYSSNSELTNFEIYLNSYKYDVICKKLDNNDKMYKLSFPTKLLPYDRIVLEFLCSNETIVDVFSMY